jgi:hypothetical protein
VAVWIDHVAVYRATPDVNDGDCVALGSDPSDGGLEFDHIQPCPAAANVDVGIDTAALADGAHDLQVQVTDAAGNTATVLDQETTTSNPTATPLPRRRGEVRARLTIRWSWNGLRTRVRSVRARGLPGSARLTVRCTGRGCARLPRRAAAGAQPGSCTIGRPPHDRDRDRLPPPRGARSTGPSETGIPVPGRARAHPSRRPAASVRRAQGMAALKVIVCGSGIAGIEGLLRLRRLAREHVELTLLSPADEFVYRPLAVLEPFTQASVRRYPLAGIAADTGASWIRDSLIRVNTSANRVIAGRGSALPYDALLLAIGAGESPPFAHAQTFTDRDAGAGFRAIVSEIERGEVATVAFVVPNWPVWSIPLYELALMTAQRTRAAGRTPRLIFITPEVRPLKAFGQASFTPMRSPRCPSLASSRSAVSGCTPTGSSPFRALTARPSRGYRQAPAGSCPSTRTASSRAPVGACSPPATPPTSRSSTAESAASRPTPPRPGSLTWPVSATGRRRCLR